MEVTNKDLMEMLRKMMSKFDECSNKVDQLGARLSHLEKNVEAINHKLEDKATHKSVHTIVEGFSQNTGALMCYNNPYNIVFYGIQARPSMPVEELFRRFMVEMLHMCQADAYNMPMVVQRFARMSQTELDPICISLRSPKDVNVIQQKAKAYHKVLLQQGIWAKWVEYINQGMLGLKKSTR